ncbi:hypothetical protein [Prochlorococcus marinus]|uniref:hypothetical protein n=1 Tax=Prochlorococcus marinus TaxID=1219 RepID=UPI0016509383|nr:hypothetical protein [Prochlorococcus marinus]
MSIINKKRLTSNWKEINLNDLVMCSRHWSKANQFNAPKSLIYAINNAPKSLIYVI